MTRDFPCTLLVDHNGDHSVAFRAALEGNGYNMDAFVNPHEAPEACSEKEHCIVIVELKPSIGIRF